jgi:hypothetical protein
MGIDFLGALTGSGPALPNVSYISYGSYGSYLLSKCTDANES